MSNKRRLGEGDDVPSIAAAAITVTLSSEGSKAVPTYSGCSADAPPQSVAQEMEPEPAVPGSEDAAVLLQAFREAIQGFRSSTDAALNNAEAKFEALIQASTHCILSLNETVAEAEADFQRANYMLEQKKAEVQHALRLLTGEDEG